MRSITKYFIPLLLLSFAFTGFLRPDDVLAANSSCSYDAEESSNSWIFNVQCEVNGSTWYLSNKPTGSGLVSGDLMMQYARTSCDAKGGDGSNVIAESVFPAIGSVVYTGVGTISFTCPGLEMPYIDIGLRIKQTSGIVHIAIENPSYTPAPSSKLQIVKNGTVYHVALVPTTDANATTARVRMSDGSIMSLRSCTASNNCQYVP